MAEKEYIERGAAIEFVEQYTPHLEGETTLQCVESALQNVPAADVVEVVRCGECIYRTSNNQRCIGRKKDWFCADGERKE